MRLTLRTMLAYLDDVLEPDEAQLIGKKISEAETASNLVHRIRDAVSRPSLPAPKVAGRAVDANTVAEYLDNTLAADRVVDFERICLMDENDVYLAEVASCHQILAEILGDAAEVDPRSRTRMYGLLAEYDARLAEAKAAAAKATAEGTNGNSGGAAAAAAGASTAEAGAAEAAPPAPAASKKKKRQVPEYLRETDGSSGMWRAAAVMLLGLLLVVVAVMAIGPEWLGDFIGRRTQVASNDSSDTPAVPADQAGTTPAVPQDAGMASPAQDAGTDPQPAAPSVTPAPETPGDSGVPAGTQTPSTPLPETPAPAVPVTPASPPGDDIGTAPSTPPGDTPSAPAPGSAPETAVPDRAAMPPMTPMPPSDSPPSDSSPLPADPRPMPMPPAGEDTPSPDVPPRVASLPDRAPASTAPGTPAPGEPGEAAGEQLGMLNSQQTVLFRQSPGAGSWQLVPVRGSVFANDLLLSPPAYRNVLMLRDFALHLRGDTLVRLGTEDGLTKVLVYYGRIEILVNDAETRLIVKAGDQPPALVTFDKPASGLALECAPTRKPGENPEEASPHYQVELYASAGEFTWDAGEPDKVYKLAAKSRYVLGTPYQQPLSDNLPDWISGDEERRLIVRQSAEDLSTELQRLPNIRLEQRLEELAYDESAKVELRSLARRSLVSLDRYQPAIEALRKYDRVDRSTQFWPDYIASLRGAVLRNRQSAKGVRETLVKLEGEKEGQELYRMLWGYTPEQLAAGEGDRLLGYLTHPETIFRVMAEWNLNLQLTGQPRTTGTFHEGDTNRIRTQVEGFRRKLTMLLGQ